MVEAARKGRRGQTVKTPPSLALVEGRGGGRDSGGRPVAPPPNFRRVAPDKPEDLSPDAARVWDLFLDELVRLPILAPLHGPALEVGCETYARWKTAKRQRLETGLLHENSQGTVANPLVGVEERASKDFRSWCHEFGLTPSAEASVSAGEVGGDDNPFA